MSVVGPFEKAGLQKSKRRLKVLVEQVIVLRPVGKVFQILGAATENALSRNRRLVRGTT